MLCDVSVGLKFEVHPHFRSICIEFSELPHCFDASFLEVHDSEKGASSSNCLELSIWVSMVGGEPAGIFICTELMVQKLNKLSHEIELSASADSKGIQLTYCSTVGVYFGHETSKRNAETQSRPFFNVLRRLDPTRIQKLNAVFRCI